MKKIFKICTAILLILLMPITAFANERYIIEVPTFPQKTKIELPMNFYCEGVESTGFMFKENKWTHEYTRADNRGDFTISISSFMKTMGAGLNLCDEIKNVSSSDKRSGRSLCGILNYPRESTRNFGVECKPVTVNDRALIVCGDDILIYPQSNTALVRPSNTGAAFNRFIETTRYWCNKTN